VKTTRACALTVPPTASATWTAPADGTASVNTLLNDGDTVLGVYTGAAVGSLTSIAADDDDVNGSSGSRTTFFATNGTTYYIAVDSKDIGAEFRISIVLDPPPNDFYADAVPVGVDQAVFVSSTQTATHEATEGSHGVVGTNASVWYAWTPSYTGTAVIDTIGTTGWDTVLAVYSGSTLPSASMVTYNDDIQAGVIRTSRVTFPVVAGSTYHVAVDGWSNQRGTFTLTFNRPPDNDMFAAPTTISSTTWSTTASARFATGEVSEPAHAGQPPLATTWYKWTASATGPVSFDTFGSEGDTVLAAYTGSSLGTLVAVAQNDDAAPATGQRWSRVEFNAVSGTTYRLAIGGVGSGGEVALVRDRAANDFIEFSQPLAGRIATATVAARHLSRQAGEAGPRVQYGYGCTAWYAWTAPGSGPTIIDTIGSTSWDTGLEVYTGPADVSALTLVDASDDAVDNAGRVRFDAVAGTTYRIRVEGYYCFSTTLDQIRVNVLLRPQNDDFVDATPVSGWSTIVAASSLGATAEDGEPDHATAPTSASVWYDWTPTQTGPATLTLFGSNFDTALGVYAGASLDSLSQLGISDDSGSTQQSILTLDVVAGSTYHVAVDGYLGATGTFSLNFNTAPPNDLRGDAIALSGGRPRITGFNTNATTEPGEPTHAGSLAHSIWYTWTALSSGPVDVDTFGTPFDTTLAVYTGPTIGTLVPVASNDDAPGRTQSRLTFAATAGTTYVFAIDGVAGAQGTTSLRINPLDPLVPVLLLPAVGGSSGDLTPTLQARYLHADGGVVGQAQFELCRASADPGGDWSSTCTSGYQTATTSMSLGSGSTASWTVPVTLDLDQDYVWRVRDLDAYTWSSWSAARAFVATAAITIELSSLGHDDAARSPTSGIEFGAVNPGGTADVGPAGSGQATPGSALRFSVASDASTEVSAGAADFVRAGGGTMGASALEWRDEDGLGETISTTSWTPFTTAAAIFETAPPGMQTYDWWMRFAPPVATPAGDYSTTLTVSVLAVP
jgi:hypothetical protein